METLTFVPSPLSRPIYFPSHDIQLARQWLRHPANAVIRGLTDTSSRMWSNMEHLISQVVGLEVGILRRIFKDSCDAIEGFDTTLKLQHYGPIVKKVTAEISSRTRVVWQDAMKDWLARVLCVYVPRGHRLWYLARKTRGTSKKINHNHLLSERQAAPLAGNMAITERKASEAGQTINIQPNEEQPEPWLKRHARHALCTLRDRLQEPKYLDAFIDHMRSADATPIV